jgi:hypothetical protein
MTRFHRVAVLMGLTVVVVFGRLIPHAPNFAPVAAAALFGSFLLRSRPLAMVPILIGMTVSDFFLPSHADWRMMALVYGAMCLPALWGPALRGTIRAGASSAPKQRIAGVLHLGASAGLASVSFFLLSNFGTWAFSNWYAPTASGLIECYVAALPFLRYTLAGDLLFSAVFFGAYVLAVRLTGVRWPVRRRYRLQEVPIPPRRKK